MRVGSWRHVAALAAGTVLYVILGWASLQFAQDQANASPVWPLAGLAIGGLSRFGFRYWPIVFLGTLANNCVVNWQHGVALGSAALAALGIALGNSAEALLGAWLMRRALGDPPELRHARGVFRFVLFAAILPPALSAACGVASLYFAGLIAAPRVQSTALTWFTGNTAGILTCAPLFCIRLLDRSRWQWSRRVALDGVLLLLMLVFLGQTISGAWLPGAFAQWPKSYMVIPLVLWIAIRLGRRSTVFAMLLLTAIGVAGTLRGFAAFPSASPEQSLLSLQLFIGVCAFVGLTVSALVYQVRFHRRALEAAVADRSQRLATVSQEKAVLTATAIHDLQSPLSGIRNVLTLARASPEVLSGSHGDGLLAEMQGEVERMLGLVSSALDASRPDAPDTASSSPAPCELRALLHRAADAEQPHADAKRIVLHRSLPAHDVVLSTHGAMIEHIVGNFLSNAVKFSPLGASVSLSLEARDGQVRIAVADEGPGIPDRDRAEIFSGRLPPNGAQPTAGESSTGLGLFLAKQLADRLGATVSCEPSPAGGSIFALTLPAIAVRSNPSDLSD